MGFWSSLAKGLGVVGAGVAGLATGGATWAAIPSIIGGAGAAIGGMAGASAENRGETDKFNQNRDVMKLRLMQEQREGQNNAYRNALRGALASNMQDASFDRSGLDPAIPVIRLGGGARPSAIGAQGRDAGGELNRQAMLELMNPEKVELSEQKQAGFWEKLAGPLSLGMTAYSQMADRDSAGQAGATMPRLNVSTDPNLQIRAPRLTLRQPDDYLV